MKLKTMVPAFHESRTPRSSLGTFYPLQTIYEKSFISSSLYQSKDDSFLPYEIYISPRFYASSTN